MPTAYLPVTSNNGYPGDVPYIREVPYWPIGFQLGDAYAPGGDAVMLSYLTQIWQYLIAGPGNGYNYIFQDVPRIGTVLDLPGMQFVGELSCAIIRITGLANSQDMIFGDPPLLSCGVAGFIRRLDPAGGAGHSLSNQGEVMPTFFEFIEGDFRTQWQYINQVEQIFFPPGRGCTNFWWHLKEGVRAEVGMFPNRRLLDAAVSLTGCPIPFDGADNGHCATKSVPDEANCVMKPDGSLCVDPGES